MATYNISESSEYVIELFEDSMFELLSLLLLCLSTFLVFLSGKLYIFHFSLAVKATCFVLGSISMKQSEFPSPTLSSRIFPGAHRGEKYNMGPYISQASDIRNFQVNLFFTSRIISLPFTHLFLQPGQGRYAERQERKWSWVRWKRKKRRQTEAKPG